MLLSLLFPAIALCLFLLLDLRVDRLSDRLGDIDALCLGRLVGDLCCENLGTHVPNVLLGAL